MEVKIDDYSEWKDNVLSLNLKHFYCMKGGKYFLTAKNSDMFLSHLLSMDDVPNYEANLKPKANVSLSDLSGYSLIAPMKPSGLSDGTLVTHDLCDKTTWHQESTAHTGIVLTHQGNNVFKDTDYTHWIDLTHGKFYQEDALPDKMIPKVYVDGVEVTVGFTIDYKLGTVTFEVAPGGVVTADFNKAGSSCFSVVPDPGKVLHLEHAELQFSEDVVMNNPIRFEIWVYNPYDLPNKVPYRTIRYKNIKDIINAANLGQGYIPKISGLNQNVIVFPFNYIATKGLISSVGAELRVNIEGDVELQGEWATATFYFLSEDE